MGCFTALFIWCDMVDSNNSDKTNSFSPSWETTLDEYKQALEAAARSQKTIEGYLQNARKYFTFLETEALIKPVHKLGKKELREYIKQLQSRVRWPNNPHIKEENRGRLSPFAVRAYARDIKTLWGWLQRDGYIDDNPLAKFPLPAVPENLIKLITPQQFATLLSNIDISTPEGSKYYCIMLILYDNGMRISELVRIRIGDIEFQNKTIKVLGKGRKERLVPIVPVTRRYISKYIDGVRSKICVEDSPYLFANSDGEPISIKSVQQYLKRLLVRSTLKEVKFSAHIIRHSFATQYLANGGNVFYLKAILGHKSLATTLTYTHVHPQDIQKQHIKFSPVAKLFKNKT